MRRPQFTLRASLMATFVAAVSCWLNRDVPVFAAVGTAGALLLLAGDSCLLRTQESSGMRFAVAVAAGAISLGAGLWLSATSLLVALARRLPFD